MFFYFLTGMCSMWYLSSPTKDQINIPCNRITGVFELYFNQCSRPPTLKVIVDPSWINIYHIYYCLYLLSFCLIPIFCPLLPATREGNGTPLQYFAWKIPWTEEPGRLQSMGSLRVGHDWATSLWLVPFMHWRRKWQPTPVFLPGESQGRGSLVTAICGVTQSRTRLKWLSSSSSY